MNDLEQFKQTYITECFELLGDMERFLLELDAEAADQEQLNAIFRCAHSIKGGSGAFGLDYITHFTHALEALLDSMREGKIAATREVVDTLLKSVDIVTQMVTCAKEGAIPPKDLGAAILGQLQVHIGAPVSPKAAMQESAQAGEELTHYTIEFMPHESLFASGNEPLLILRELSRLGEMRLHAHDKRIPSLDELEPTHCYLGWSMELISAKPEAAVREVFEFVEDHCDLNIMQKPSVPTPQEGNAGTPRPAAEDGGSKAAHATSIRVDLEKVDRLVNMVGELVITEAMLRASARELPGDKFTALLRGIDELSQHTRELQEAVMAVRMQPVKSIFSRMPRIVRDLSGQLGKEIRLVTSGENTEVDKTVIEQLADPLTHMIRNSVDHGIEKPEDRVHAGKPAEGVIHLSAEHRGGRILIEISDNGGGINRAKVLAKAKEKGLIEQGAAPSDDEIDHLIFAAGFSTAEKVTNVSGRGVGMDVVKRNIESLGGTVRVTNMPGQGSIFTVSLPLTLAILDGMIVRVGTEHYIVPIGSIIETMRPKSGDVQRVEGRGDVINVRGEFVPLVYLHRLFDISGAQGDPCRALIVLVESNHQKMGLVVDELIGQQQVVIKSLEANTDPVKGISGATILGDGKVSLILEISELGALCKGQTAHQAQLLLAA